MKNIFALTLCLVALTVAQAQHPQKFDEYGRILPSDENARLDNLAIKLQDEPGYVAWLVVYAGRRSCIDEARAHALRARNHLVKKRGIQADRVMWIDGGYQEEPLVEIWAYPRWLGAPSLPASLDKSEVQRKKCKTKYSVRRMTKPYRAHKRLQLTRFHDVSHVR